MPDIAQEDIAYQPAAKAYSFSANQAVPPTSQSTPELKPEQTPEQKPQRKPLNWKPLLLFLAVIASLTLIFLIFLGVLNFFNVISLSTIYPKQLGWLPQIAQTFTPAYDQKAGIWTIKGTFYQYNDEKIKVKTGAFKTMDFVYRTDSVFLKSNLTVNDANPSGIQAGTLFDLDQKENLGKTVKVEYKTENKINYISSFILYK